jgi:hypothetical protein
LSNQLDNIVRVFKDFIIRESQETDTECLDIFPTITIANHRILRKMAIAVDFDCELESRTIKKVALANKGSK